METEYRGEPVAGGTYPAEIWRDFMNAAKTLLEEREAEELRRSGKEPEQVDPAITTEAPPGVPTTPGSTTPAQAEPPAPTGGDPRPETPEAEQPSGGAGDDAPEPAPEPEPAPTPAPAPAPPPTPGGTGGAQPGGAAAPPG